MAGKNSCMNLFNKVWAFIWIFWAIFSTVVYSFACIVLSGVSRKVAHIVERLWNSHLLWVAGIRVRVRGFEKIDKKERYVFIVNHQSALDIPALFVGLKRHLSFIAKKELFFIPFFGWGIAAVGHIWIDRSNARKARDSILRAISHLKRKNVSLVLFPEGTRSENGALGEFKQASFTLALQAGVKIVPVVLHDARLCLPKSHSMVRPGTIHIDICDPLSVSENETTKAELCNQIRDIISDTLQKGPAQ